MKTRRNLVRLILALLLVALGHPRVEAQQPAPGIAAQDRWAGTNQMDRTWPLMAGNRDLFWFSMAAQHRAAQRMQREEAAQDRVANTATSALHQNRPGGASTAQFFGRTAVTQPATGPNPPARFDRYRHFFGHRGG